VVTKSGGNELHGDGLEFLRNTDLDARNFFSIQRAVFRQNQFGGALGGPIKHDRMFFFADYQGTRMTQGVDSGLIAVPSLQDQAGNLSDLSSSLRGTVTGGYWARMLGQELGYPVSVGEPYYLPGCTSTSECVFPNGRIPQSAWSTPATTTVSSGVMFRRVSTTNWGLRGPSAAQSGREFLHDLGI
jgi:hypothetical protein